MRNQVTEDQSFAVRQNRWILACCPCSGEEVVGSGWHKSFSLPNGEASWWYCPACYGWHVVMGDEALVPPGEPVDHAQTKQSIKPSSGVFFIKKHEAKFLPDYLF